MKAKMWPLLAGVLALGAAGPANAAPLAASHGLKVAGEDAGVTQAGYRHRHHRHWNYPRYRYRHYEPYYGYYEPYYYRPYRYRRYYYDGPRFGIYFGGHRWRRNWW